MKQTDENRKIYIECDCGSHMLQVTSDIEHLDEAIEDRTFIQEYYLAMFRYGSHSDKHKWYRRFGVALRYLWSGNMFADQLLLTPKEAKGLADFINETIIE